MDRGPRASAAHFLLVEEGGKLRSRRSPAGRSRGRAPPSRTADAQAGLAGQRGGARQVAISDREHAAGRGKLRAMNASPQSSERAAQALLAYWTAAGPRKWFAKDEAFDKELRQRFLGLHERAAQGELAAWRGEAESALALVLLLDQFPRNAFRGTPRMYATDALAREEADRAIAAGFDHRVAPALRVFFYLPFEHSESLADQERSVALQQDMSDLLQYALQHRDIIRCFGRFPHRNAILGRESSPEERAFLESGGFSG